MPRRQQIDTLLSGYQIGLSLVIQWEVRDSQPLSDMGFLDSLTISMTLRAHSSTFWATTSGILTSASSYNINLSDKAQFGGAVGTMRQSTLSDLGI